ncbi:hypothetical protein KBX06_08890 [Micromonospora sp. C31]|uniref:hypothetical protein n=1 Tax=Micromonospora sp. C31 TaxID=2824876 RepID=UPI001B37FBF2|nr:hypothetical protein [Micromonospora sp. C31]MBQ1073280.1 hypothetical protein [Micromonospora sp. C31]
MTSNRWQPLAVPLLPVVALVLGGCGSSGDTPNAGTPPAASSTSPASAPATPSPSGVAPSPSPLSARDGTDVRACRDGTCEIVVRGKVDVPLDRRFGFTDFTVTFIPPKRTQFFGGDPVNGNLRGHVDGTGELNANDISVQVVAISDSGAVLRFSPR